MASISKIVRNAFAIPSQTTTKLSMLSAISNKLGSRSCSHNPSAPTMYDCRKYGHKLPENTTAPCFETLRNIPTGVFRNTQNEMLGLGAGKCCYYQNPEYFSFHHMSFFDLNMGLRQYRIPCPKTGRKPN